MTRLLLVVCIAIACSGCAAVTLFVQQHPAGITAFTAVAGAVATAGGAVVQIDEAERRIERRLEGAGAAK